MKLIDKEMEASNKVIKHHAELLKNEKHAHVPARDKDKFKVSDVDIDDWEVAE